MGNSSRPLFLFLKKKRVQGIKDLHFTGGFILEVSRNTFRRSPNPSEIKKHSTFSICMPLLKNTIHVPDLRATYLKYIPHSPFIYQLVEKSLCYLVRTKSERIRRRHTEILLSSKLARPTIILIGKPPPFCYNNILWLTLLGIERVGRGQFYRKII